MAIYVYAAAFCSHLRHIMDSAYRPADGAFINYISTHDDNNNNNNNNNILIRFTPA